MNYTILESRIEFLSNKMNRIILLVDCTRGGSKPLSDVRAIYATSKPCSGYMFILPTAILSEQLLQKVAGGGMESMDRDKIFPGWKKKYQGSSNLMPQT